MRRSLALAILVAIGLCAVCAAASLGTVHVPVARVVKVAFSAFARDDSWESLVVLKVRLPRALVGYLVGGALAVAGAALQAVFKNPLADPGILGVSNGAALAAAVAIYAGLAARVPWALPVAACLGALVVTLALVGIGLARPRGRGTDALLLGGVALANLAAAGTTLVLSFALASYDVGRQVLQWLLGGLDGRTWAYVAMGGAPILLGAAFVLVHARSLDALVAGDLTAAAVGVDVPRVRLRMILATAVLTGISVAIGGAIGFVGLLLPHLARRLVGAGHTALIPACFLGGGAFVVLADLLARTVIAPEELRLGAVTAAIGAPFLLFVLARKHAKDGA